MAKGSGFEGFESLGLKLKTLTDPKQIGPTLKSAVRSGMAEPLKKARQLIPVGVDAHQTIKGRTVAPGFARRSIRVISKIDRKSGGQRAYALLGVRKEAFYAVQFVELGTSKMPAQPWLRPAFAASKDPAIRMIGQGIDRWIVDVAKRKTREGQSSRAAQLLSTVDPAIAAETE